MHYIWQYKATILLISEYIHPQNEYYLIENKMKITLLHHIMGKFSKKNWFDYSYSLITKHLGIGLLFGWFVGSSVGFDTTLRLRSKVFSLEIL